MLQYIAPATGLLFTLENILWINIGVFVGAVFAAIPGLSVILCVILFLPVTYTMTAIPGMMFLLGIYCAGGYGGSVSAILINTPGTPHAAATMLDGHPLSQQGRTKAALKIALYASTFGGIFSALMLLFLGPQVAKVAAQLGTAEYFMVCVFGLTIIAGVSGKSIIRGLVSACLGLLISCVGTDPMTSYDRFTFGIPRLYLGLDLAVCLIGLFALVEILAKVEKKRGDLHMDTRKIKDDGKITRQEYKRMARPVLMSSIIGVLAWVLRKLDLPPVPILLGLVLGRMTETNFRRALLISNGDPSIFVQSIYCKIFLALIIVAVAAIIRGKLKEQKAAKAAASQ